MCISLSSLGLRRKVYIDHINKSTQWDPPFCPALAMRKQVGLISRLMSPHSARVGKALASSELALCFYLCQNCHSVLIYLIFHCGYHDHTVCFVPYRLSSRLTEIFVGTGKSLCTHTKSSGEGQGGWDTVLQVCAQAERVSDRSTASYSRVTVIMLLECCTYTSNCNT